ncbi:uncharacterized protein SETTUDRAFT_162753 [Exserohilum turcica Et28A]|uniref:Uncharacterized protein n=1 Tax=Exserohilum turcicum (strain 28A) TaxID=671987 RepID=R0KTS9_EXST2|nr:uncharacterized protein SETTUDRAFT_162753 [Exserohilum turcica Et28A]EOA92334.1 hypothetical protein SETTUDRAFT_162753 [Exserohilum turcica Et28A]
MSTSPAVSRQPEREPDSVWGTWSPFAVLSSALSKSTATQPAASPSASRKRPLLHPHRACSTPRAPSR